MQVFTFAPKDCFGSNMYILTSNHDAAIIDPSVEFDDLRCVFNIEEFFVRYIILTHAHFDHMLAIESWVNNTSAQVVVGAQDAQSLNNPYLNCYKIFVGEDKGYSGDYISVSEGDKLVLGNADLKIIETPGHSIGSVSIAVRDKIFVGDVIFADGAVGRTDLPGGNYRLLIDSIKKISLFPKDTLIYSGHGRTHKVEELYKQKR